MFRFRGFVMKAARFLFFLLFFTAYVVAPKTAFAETVNIAVSSNFTDPAKVTACPFSQPDLDRIEKAIESMKDRVMRGEALASAAAGTGVFTPMALQMIAIGEETGMLDELLDEVGEMYGNEVQYALKTLSQQIGRAHV